ncbi:hypothetical protein BD311DRAFT_354424 [Dichomitus squalens]|uniref:F-box domain-containing protein n=1 Tax=Dichomitus squalens TaxID=114155 RepID=A0A4V2K095_9APHY|nr:hypothetical protein BD311DRAFT_354424 [Dichomitus squalens]
MSSRTAALSTSTLTYTLSSYEPKSPSGLATDMDSKTDFGSFVHPVPPDRSSTSTGVLGNAPLEIFRGVLAILRQEEAQKALSSCSRACKSWNEVVRPYLFASIVVRRKTTFAGFATFLQSDVACITRHIQSLVLSRPLRRSVIIRRETYGSWLAQEGAENPDITQAQWDSFGGACVDCPQLDCDVLASILSHLPNLKRLTLHGLRLVLPDATRAMEATLLTRKLDYFELSEIWAVGDASLIPSLFTSLLLSSVRELVMEECGGTADAAADMMHSPSKRCQLQVNVEYLTMRGAFQLSLGKYGKFLDVRTLRSLSLHKSDWATPDLAESAWRFIRDRCKYLEEVDVDLEDVIQLGLRESQDDHYDEEQSPPTMWLRLGEALSSCKKLSRLCLRFALSRAKEYPEKRRPSSFRMFGSIFSGAGMPALSELQIQLEWKPDTEILADIQTVELWDIGKLNEIESRSAGFPDLQRVAITCAVSGSTDEQCKALFGQRMEHELIGLHEANKLSISFAIGEGRCIGEPSP